MRGAMRLRRAPQELDAPTGGMRGLRERADRLARACENAGSYSELFRTFGQLQAVDAELATAGPRDPERDRRLRTIVDRLHASAPLADLMDLAAAADFGSRPPREAY